MSNKDPHYKLRNFTTEQYDECDVWASRIALELKGRNLPAAKEILEEAFLSMQSKDTGGHLLSVPLCSVMDTREYNALEGMRILTIGDYLNTTTEELMTIPNFKEGSVLKTMKQVLMFVVKRCVKIEQQNGHI